MLDVRSRLNGVVAILNASNADIAFAASVTADTGYVAVPPALLADAVMGLAAHTHPTDVSLDLGCGNGGWLLLCAAAGFASHGVELNPALVSHLERNYALAVEAGFIDALTPCSWTIGDMMPVGFSASYGAFRSEHVAENRTMPTGAVVEDSYARLPITIALADIIYCWAWPVQSAFLFAMLATEAKDDTLFVLPSYEKYAGVEGKLRLVAYSNDGGVFVGRKTNPE